MAVYPWCQKCDRRRDAPKSGSPECEDKSGHKRHLGWVADVSLGRKNRARKLFPYDTDKPKEAADLQASLWKTEYKRSGLIPRKKEAVLFEKAADEWWAGFQMRIKTPMRSEFYRYKLAKTYFERKYLTDLTYEDGDGWLNNMIESGLAVATINRKLRSLKWILNYAVKRGYIQVNPFAEVKQLKGENVRVRWMVQAEINTLVQAAYQLNDERLVEVIAVGLNTGFRKGNLERLAARDIGNGIVTAQKTKSGNPYDVPIAPDIEMLLRRLAQQNQIGPILDTSQLDKRFRAAAKLAKLYSDPENRIKVSDEEKVTIHTLRHTFAALYLKRGGTIDKLSRLLGHASSAITDRVYAHICPKELAAQAPLISTPIIGIDQAQLKVI